MGGNKVAAGRGGRDLGAPRRARARPRKPRGAEASPPPAVATCALRPAAPPPPAARLPPDPRATPAAGPPRRGAAGAGGRARLLRGRRGAPAWAACVLFSFWTRFFGSRAPGFPLGRLAGLFPSPWRYKGPLSARAAVVIPALKSAVGSFVPPQRPLAPGPRRATAAELEPAGSGGTCRARPPVPSPVNAVTKRPTPRTGGKK